GLVGAKVVVDAFAPAKAWAEAGDGRRVVGLVIELLAVGAVGPFDPAVELGAAGREFEEENAALLAGRLEVGHELGPTVDLDGTDGEGGTFNQLIEGAHSERR